jgi:hypothetical protein
VRDNSVVRWLIAAIAVFGVVALLAWARNDPGVDDRDGDPEDVIAVSVDTTG